ncbi:hypothetical protein Scel_03450 [Streptomyces cellostaticus]|nr:hypothetical protein Scel_03450 [Streptomyces cellostaticus]
MREEAEGSGLASDVATGGFGGVVDGPGVALDVGLGVVAEGPAVAAEVGLGRGESTGPGVLPGVAVAAGVGVGDAGAATAGAARSPEHSPSAAALSRMRLMGALRRYLFIPEPKMGNGQVKCGCH